MMDIRYINNHLFIAGDTIDFSYTIKSIKLYEDLILVLLRVPKGEINKHDGSRIRGIQTR